MSPIEQSTENERAAQHQTTRGVRPLRGRSLRRALQVKAGVRQPEADVIKKDDLLALLDEGLHDPRKLQEVIARFQSIMWHTPDEGMLIESSEKEILANLAYDLDYFEPDPQSRAEDPSFYGPDRAQAEIRTALQKIRQRDDRT